jgi:hypothetical protein
MLQMAHLFRITALVVPWVVLVGAHSACADIITFTDTAPPSDFVAWNVSPLVTGSTYTEGNFKLTTSELPTTYFADENSGDVPIPSGDYLFMANTTANLILQSTSGTPFTLISILATGGGAEETAVDVMGFSYTAGKVTQSIYPSDDPSFQSFTFGPSFTNLASVVFTHYGAGAFAYDSFTMNPVPEPSALAALIGLLGMGIVGCCRRRKKAA